MSFELVSPVDRRRLARVGDVLVTDDGAQRYPIVDGIAHLIRPDRLAEVDAFARDYAAVRRAEGRRSETPDYYRALPFDDLTGAFSEQWQRRARGYVALLEVLGEDPVDVVDAGAGNCWMAARLTARGHRVLAVDVSVDAGDGLGARHHHDEEFDVARAEITALPLADGTVDAVVANAAAHYVPLLDLVAEAERVLRPGGRLVIVDSPVYRDRDAGCAMVEDMRRHITELGVDAARHDGPGFLLERELEGTGLRWRRVDLDGGRLAGLRRAVAGRRAGRELATMPLLVATPTADTRAVRT